MVPFKRSLAVLAVVGMLSALPVRAEDPAASRNGRSTTLTMFDDPKPLSTPERAGAVDSAHTQSLAPSSIAPMSIAPSPTVPTTICPTSLCAEQACSSCYSPGLIGYVDYLHWRARPRGLTFASFADPASLPGSPDVVATESLDPGSHDGIRAGLGYRFETGWEIIWNYTHFNSSDALTAIADPTGTTSLLATQSFFSTQAMDSVHASGALRLNLHDIEAGWGTGLNDCVDYRMFGSVRLARIDEDFDQSYSYHADPVTVVTGEIHMPLRMDAAGLRLGGEFQWRAADGLRLFGRLAQSLLVADFETRRIETDTLHGSVLNGRENDSHFVPVLEAATGITWGRGPLEISGGYEMSNWFNMIDPSRDSRNLFIDGCFVRIAFVH